MTALDERPSWTPPVWTPPAPGWKPLLSTREVQVMQLLADGRDTVQAGQALFLSPDTVKTHIARAMRKTKTPNRTALIAWGFRTGALT